MSPRRLLPVACLALGAAAVGQDAPPDKPRAVTEVADVRYVDGDDAHPRKHLLDLYVPERRDTDVARAVRWLHVNAAKHGGDPGRLVLHADGDMAGLPAQARLFHAALRTRPVRADLAEIVGRSHLTIVSRIGTPDDPVTERIARFVFDVTKPAPKGE